MITNFKTYEKFFTNTPPVEGPQVGDYVICEIDHSEKYYNELLKNFFDNNVGQLIVIKNNFIFLNAGGTEYYKYNYFIKYDDIPKEVKKSYVSENLMPCFKTKNVIEVKRSFIKHWSDDKNELESKIIAKKYNL